jgi:acyl-coenzyme A thioesterase PaaI-like protein
MAVSAIATAAGFNAETAWSGRSRVNPAHIRAISRLVVSLNGLMALDYNTSAIDEMVAENPATLPRLETADMIEKAAGKLKSDGWSIVETTGFLHLIGPLWQRLVDGEHEFALVAQEKHHNRRGLVQGGVLMTFADRTCGITARVVSGKPMLATVQLDTHFVEAGKIGETLISRPRVVRSTRSLIFITTEVSVDRRCIAMASGVFKILKNE